MWRIRRLAILPVLALLITAMAAISMPLANAGTSPDPGKPACAVDRNGQLRYAAVPAECGYQGKSAARRHHHHQPPVLADIEFSALRYAEGAPPVRVTASLTVSSPATGTLAGATVSVSSGFTAGQDVLAFTGQSGITGSYIASTGVLTFTGTATVSAYMTELRSVTYRDTNAATTYGTRAISFQVSDGEPDHPLSNVVSRTVLIQAKPPVAVNDKAATGKNAPVTINVLANDTDPAGLPLTIASVNTTATKGTVTVNPGQTTVTYNPNGQFAGLAAGQTATDKFTYKATDGHQTSSSATVTVTITGSGTAPQPPTVTTHSYHAVGNTPLGVGTTPAAPAATVTGTVLTGDSDPDPAATLSVTANTQPAHGAVTVNPNGTFTYLPNPGFSGADSFQVTIAGSNDPALTATETVTITVGTVVWYVNDSQTAAGNGEAGSPFGTLAAADAAAGADSVVFLYQGNAPYTGGVTMQPGEDLWGQPNGLTVGGYPLVPAGGSAPGIDGTVDLAEGADVEGVTLPAGSGEYGGHNNYAGLIEAVNVNDATVGATSPVLVEGQIDVSGGDGDLNFGDTNMDGALSPGNEVAVANRTGGTVTFGGLIFIETIALTDNAGATIAFTDTLNLTGFAATGGGTITATGDESRLAGPLLVENTTIGAAGLTFQSVSSGYYHPTGFTIDLDNTGSSGSLTVTGTGTPGSGGTIGNTEGAAIELTTTYAPSFTDIDSEPGGIDGSQVNGLTLADSTITGLNFAPNGTGSTDGLTGTVSITNSTITGSAAIQFATAPASAGTNSVTFTGNTVNGGGVDITADGNGTTCAAITGNSITGPGQGGADIDLDQNDATTIKLPGYMGGSGDTSAVESFLTGGNNLSGTPAAIATVSGSGGGFTGASGC